jgi:NAD(P)-dependent dehydrogenase (short-subunit alcohol dehydrogenase family)
VTAAGKLAGAIAIVTGASEGIAETIARTLAREGASVALVSRSLPRVQRVAHDIEAGGGTAIALQADVTRSHDVRVMVDAVLARWDHVDILVNGVGGFSGHGSILETSEEDWDRVVALNMKSAFLCSQAVVKSMMGRRTGRIVNIGSQAASAPSPQSNSFLPYAAAKALWNHGQRGVAEHHADAARKEKQGRGNYRAHEIPEPDEDAGRGGRYCGSGAVHRVEGSALHYGYQSERECRNRHHLSTADRRWRRKR